ncbi:hypothetical protein KH400_13255 [Desertibacillus haloalkaliphilus]|nr:hypothetical protein [Desertibacillus haloalkaliphilus]
MFSLRGDAWKFYQKLRRTERNGDSVKQLNEIKEIEEIQSFYVTLDDDTLHNIRYRMLKEKEGSGMIPIFVTSIPWLLFIFSKQLQQLLFEGGTYLWLVFIFIYVTVLFFSVIIHFRENAWANVHIELIGDVLKRRGDQK